MNWIKVLLTLALSSGVVYAATLHVPGEYATIQAGIDAALEGDSVLVADGTYTGSGNKDLDFLGKAITVASENGPMITIIDCEFDGRGAYFHENEEPTSVFCGFTITNGLVSEQNGGGLYLDYASPTIRDCIISNCTAAENGGGMLCLYSNSLITGCVVTDNDAEWSGGGILAHGSDLVLEDCLLTHNSAQYGGGLMCEQSNPEISNCQFIENAALYDGGGMFVGFYSYLGMDDSRLEGNSARRGGAIWSHKSTLVINYNVISYNTADDGGGCYYAWDSTNYLVNCTFHGNEASGNGGAINVNTCCAVLTNCIVANSGGNGGIYFGPDVECGIGFSDCHGNENGPFAGQIPQGLGELVLTNANGDSCDIGFNIYLDPLFYATTGDSAFFLTSASPCIDAGDPHVTFDPDGTVRDIGAFYFDQSADLVVTLIPHDPPIVIPSTGGPFAYDLILENTGPTTVTFDFWLWVTLPGGARTVDLVYLSDLTLSVGQPVTRSRTQYVPPGAPGGSYVFNAYAIAGADTSYDNFDFTKLGATGTDWASGWIEDGEEFTTSNDPYSILQPAEFGICQVYPNPFNPATTIGFVLPEAAIVDLSVYDVTGRCIAELVNGRLSAGTHEAVFDGSGLASGIYLARFSTKDITHTRKLVLMK